MKTTILILSIFAFLFTGCGARRNVEQTSATFDEGVVINGVRWATRNVGGYGRFTRNPHEAGGRFTFYQARRNACPPGWRLPTREEFQSLIVAESEWIRVNGVRGRSFGTAPNQLFLPAAGHVIGGDIETWSTWGGVMGGYLSGTQRADGSAWLLAFSDTRVVVGSGSRTSRYSVRCVADAE